MEPEIYDNPEKTDREIQNYSEGVLEVIFVDFGIQNDLKIRVPHGLS